MIGFIIEVERLVLELEISFWVMWAGVVMSQTLRVVLTMELCPQDQDSYCYIYIMFDAGMRSWRLR